MFYSDWTLNVYLPGQAVSSIGQGRCSVFKKHCSEESGPSLHSSVLMVIFWGMHLGPEQLVDVLYLITTFSGSVFNNELKRNNN